MWPVTAVGPPHLAWATCPGDSEQQPLAQHDRVFPSQFCTLREKADMGAPAFAA